MESIPDGIVDLAGLELAAFTRLNNQHARETSWLSEEEFERLVGIAFYARGFESDADADAFLIALEETALYRNPNFEFFLARHARFVYIDRIITANHARRRGLARRLYDDLFVRARGAGHAVVGCEVNLDPPNPGSDSFHARLGFVEVGRARLENGKTVRYLERSLRIAGQS